MKIFKGGLILGRFQGITKQHQKLLEVAFQDNDIDIVVVQIIQGGKTSQDIYKNPFDQEIRTLFVKAIISDLKRKYNKSQIVDVFNVGYIPSISEYIKEKYGDIEIVKVYCGTDRKQSYEEQLKRANLNDKIKVEELPRNVESDDEISQTKLRNALFNGDYETQKQLLATPVLQLFDLIVDYINFLKQEYGEDVFTPKPKRKTSKQTTKLQEQLLELIDEKSTITEISHIEDIPVDEFIDFIQQMLYKTEPLLTSIKIDGVQNLSFGIDSNERIYTIRRKSFGGKQTPWYDWKELPKIPAYNAIRSQTQFVTTLYEKHKDIFDKYLSKYYGKQIEWECELVSTLYTNTIKYNSPTSKTIYLRPLPRFTDSSIDINELDKDLLQLYEELKSVEPITVNVTQYVPDLENGDIVQKPISETWSVDTVEYFDIDKYLSKVKNEIEKLLNELKQFLNKKLGEIPDISVPDQFKDLTVFEQIMIKLNKVPKEYRPQMKELREMLQNYVRSNYMLNIKDILIQYVNDVITDEKQQEIEGVVLRKLTGNTDELVKLVDRDKFSLINKNMHNIVKDLLKEFGEKRTEMLKQLGLPTDVKFTKDNRIDLIKELSEQYKDYKFDLSIIRSFLKDMYDSQSHQLENVKQIPDIIDVTTRIKTYKFDVSQIKDRIQFELKEILQKVKKSEKYLQMYEQTNQSTYVIQVQYGVFLDEEFSDDDVDTITDNYNRIVEKHINNLLSTILEQSDSDNTIEEPIDYRQYVDKMVTRYIGIRDNYTVLYSERTIQRPTDIVNVILPIKPLMKKYKFYKLSDLLTIVKSSIMKYLINEEDITSPGKHITTTDTYVYLDYYDFKVKFYVGNEKYLYDKIQSGENDKLTPEEIEQSIIDNYNDYDTESTKLFKNYLLLSLFENIDYNKFIDGGLYDVDNSKLVRYEGKIKNGGFYIVLKSKPMDSNEQWDVEKEFIPTNDDLSEILDKLFNVQVSTDELTHNSELLKLIITKLDLDVSTLDKVLETFEDYCTQKTILYPEYLIVKYKV